MKTTTRCRMVWSEYQNKWLCQKYSKLKRDWVFIYDFWDCGNVIKLFMLAGKGVKKKQHNFTIIIEQEKDDGV